MTAWTSKRYGPLPKANKKQVEQLLWEYQGAVTAGMTVDHSTGRNSREWYDGREQGLWLALGVLGLHEARRTAYREGMDLATTLNTIAREKEKAA